MKLRHTAAALFPAQSCSMSTFLSAGLLSEGSRVDIAPSAHIRHDRAGEGFQVLGTGSHELLSLGSLLCVLLSASTSTHVANAMECEVQDHLLAQASGTSMGEQAVPVSLAPVPGGRLLLSRRWRVGRLLSVKVSLISCRQGSALLSPKLSSQHP